ncbi:EamA family transporter [Brachybacterium hainanense]|uniref:DMT family transporter n=1 Tax=Brachybacterium hainanense TaxID=1541174 RepID=A0ABV6RB39_9MICO
MNVSSPAAPASGAPVLLILGSCTSLQFGAVLATTLFGELGSWGTTALRLGIAGILLLVIARPALHRLDRTQWLSVLALGAVMGGMNGSFYAAIERIPLGTAVTLEFLGPLAVAALLSARRSDLLWVALALAGVGLFGLESVTGAARLDPVGVVFALVAGVFWGLYVIASARAGRLVPGQGGLAASIMIGALVVLPLGSDGALRGLLDPHLLLVAAGTAVLASLLPYTLELAALRRLPRHVFGILLSLEPVIAMLAGMILLSQGLSALRVLAAVLVVSASIGVTATARRAETVPTRSTLTGEIPVVEPAAEEPREDRPSAHGEPAPLAP